MLTGGIGLVDCDRPVTGYSLDKPAILAAVTVKTIAREGFEHGQRTRDAIALDIRQ